MYKRCQPQHQPHSSHPCEPNAPTGSDGICINAVRRNTNLTAVILVSQKRPLAVTVSVSTLFAATITLQQSSLWVKCAPWQWRYLYERCSPHHQPYSSHPCEPNGTSASTSSPPQEHLSSWQKNMKWNNLYVSKRNYYEGKKDIYIQKIATTW